MSRLYDHVKNVLLVTDPAIATVLSIIATAVATAILRWSAYMWPSKHHRRGAVKDQELVEDEDV